MNFKLRIKSTSAVLAVLLSASIFASCSGGASQNNFLFATGGSSGTYYPLGGAIAQVVNDNVSGTNVTVQTSGASKENIKLLEKGEADFAIVQNDVMDYAANGIELFEGEPVSGVSSVAALYPEVIQIVSGVDSGINSVADLVGKRVSIGAAGSGVEANALQILDAYGISVSDIKPSYLSFTESGNAFKDGQIDAFFVTAGIPNTAITEISVTRPINLISVEGDALKTLLEKHSFYSEFTIPKETYKTENDIKTVAVKAMIACSTSLDEEVVYNFTKAIFENLDTLGSAHAKALEFSLEQADKNMTVALHPGAARYFAEKIG